MGSGILSKSNPKILCLVPALPSEIRRDTLLSIFNQSVPVAATIILTERVAVKLPFPAKISLVMNHMLENIRVENYDYLLRVDADTVLPSDFLAVNLAGDFDVLGYGPAQLIKVSSFQKYMNGRFHPDHDDGYHIVKFRQCGLKVSLNYPVAPVINRQPGFHHGVSYFVGQGELHYRYGYDPLGELLVVFGKYRQYHPFGVFYLAGYFKALLLRRRRFDVAGPILYQHLLKYRHPSRFLHVGKFRGKILRGIKLG